MKKIDVKTITNNIVSFIERIKSKKVLLIIIEVAFLALAFYLVAIVNNNNRREIWEFQGSDIRFEYLHAQRIGAGENIYADILNQDLLTNNKYATLLPLYYYFLHGVVSLTQVDGIPNFEGFMDLHRSILLVAELSTALFTYLIFRREDKHLLGFLSATFLMFNRWIINNIASGKQDVIAIAFLMASLYFFTSKKSRDHIISYFLFGMSLGLKQIGIFLAPIYVMPLLVGRDSIKAFLINMLAFSIPTFVVGLPIIINSPAAFYYSMLFSFTREPNKLNSDFGYRNMLVLYNVGVEKNNIRYYLLPRLPLVVFSFLNFILLLARKIPLYLYCLTSLFIFIAFNPVLFSQYFTWVPPFLFLSALKAFGPIDTNS
jgi:hypothetical protein